jgi:hypothetical protein
MRINHLPTPAAWYSSFEKEEKVSYFSVQQMNYQAAA